MENEIWEYYRREAKEWAAKRDQAIRSSRNAYQIGDGLTAKSESILGKQYKSLCDEANKSAADAIFYQNNENLPSDVIDLHRLYVNEAMDKLEERVIFAIQNGLHQLDVIVGQGHHSEDGPKIKPSVEYFAKKNNIPYTFSDRNPGCLSFNLGQSDEILLTTETERINQESIHITEPSSRFESVENHQTHVFGKYMTFFGIAALFILGLLKLLGFW